MSLPPFTYSPFPCGFLEIEAVHLEHLRHADEGWYLDYKREPPDAEKIGKSLSSFANTFGGWLVFGVDAPGNGSPTPTAFPGLDTSGVARARVLLQRAAAQHVHPPPFFETRVIEGPDAASGLAAGRAIVIARVPPGAAAPYVHSSGRIYRRVADGSEPKHETDRHILELLLERSRAARSRWRAIVERDFELSKGEAEQPFLHLFLSCDPFEDRGAGLSLSMDDFARVMRDPASETGGLPFDNVFAWQHGWIARQTAGNDPSKLVFTWRQRFDTTAIVSVPIPHGQLSEVGDVFLTAFDGYDHAEAMSEACREAHLAHGCVLDLNFIPYILHGVLERYRVLLDVANVGGDFFVKARLDEIWRAVPFLDLEEHVGFVREHGVPVIQEARAYAPGEIEALMRVPRQRENAAAESSDPGLLDALLVMVTIAQAVGVPLPARNLVSELPSLLARTKHVQDARGAATRRRR